MEGVRCSAGKLFLLQRHHCHIIETPTPAIALSCCDKRIPNPSLFGSLSHPQNENRDGLGIGQRLQNRDNGASLFFPLTLITASK
jgi:hypothetical protein